MLVVLRLAHMTFGLCLLAACSASPSPTALTMPSPSLEPQIATFSPSLPAKIPERTLVAGQWNMLFYHPQLEKVILVNGGPDRGKPAGDPLELWAWDGAEWTLVSADPQGPRWRNFGGVAFDTRRNVLVVYGGLQNSNNRFEDTWEWDGQSWTQVDVSGPGFREGAVMSYDEARGVMVLFGGGNEEFEMLGDTWTWDGSWWTQASTSGPSPRFPSVVVYDAARQKVLLFSGHFVSANEYIEYSDFWEWDGTAWREIVVDGEKPSARNIAQMVYIPTSQTVLLFGGGGKEFVGDLWSWNGNAWTQLAESGVPARSGPGAAWDPLRNRLVFFGGVDRPGGTAITDTWEWDGQNWACVWGCKSSRSRLPRSAPGMT